MALRFKNRNQAPPNGWRFEQHETGWKNWISAPTTVWDFKLLCYELQRHRLANRQRFPLLRTSLGEIMSEVEHLNAVRVSQIPGATDVYLVPDGPAVSPKASAPPPAPLSQRLAGVAEGLKRVNAGRVMLLDWENDGYPQVDQGTADRRALVCLGCPQNGKGDFTRWFTVPASERIKRQIERLQQVKLSTPYDDQLGVCEVCLCPLVLKMHTPIEYIQKYISPEIRRDLEAVKNTSVSGKCWVLEELKG